MAEVREGLLIATGQRHRAVRMYAYVLDNITQPRSEAGLWILHNNRPQASYCLLVSKAKASRSFRFARFRLHNEPDSVPSSLAVDGGCHVSGMSVAAHL